MKTTIFKILLAFFSAAFSLLILEVGYRLHKQIPLLGNIQSITQSDRTDRSMTFRRSLNGRVLYEPIPGARSRYTGVENIISSQGLRDREYPLKKPENTYRIAFIGDSIVYGYGIPVEQTVSKQLEAMLNKNPKMKMKFEVINFGVPGWGTTQEVAWYQEKVKPFAPDLVIVGYCLNDSFVASWEYGLFINQRFPLWAKFYSIEAVLDGIRIASERRLFTTSAPQQRVNDPVFSGIKSIKDDIASIQPTLLTVFPGIRPFDKYGDLDIHKRVREAAAYYDIPHFDLFEPLSAYDYRQLRVQQFVNTDEIHLGDFGNRIAATAIMGWLTTQFSGRNIYMSDTPPNADTAVGPEMKSPSE